MSGAVALREMPGRQAADRTLAVLDRAAKLVIIVMMTTMVSVVSAQVVARYLLSGSIGWADEIGRLTFVWCMFLAIPLGTRARAHIGIELLTARLPDHARSMLGRLMALTGMLLVALVAWESVKIAIDQWDELMASVNFSAGWFIVPVAVGMMHTALHLLRITAFGPYGEVSSARATE
jgi:TRAP-type C4-dicarboxylate transport system permease small subunit